jgi:hypothetical protein
VFGIEDVVDVVVAVVFFWDTGVGRPSAVNNEL